MTCTRPWLYKMKDGSIIELPCGRCMACRIRKKSEWSLRLLNELEYWKESCFMTLTYKDENLPLDLSLNLSEIQKFIKRLRKAVKKKIKVFYCGEYGEENLRPHYHLIVFGWRPLLTDLYLLGEKKSRKLYASRFIEGLWTFGFNNIGVVEHESIQYVCGYTTKKLYGPMAIAEYGARVRPFMHCSKGLGLRYALDHKDQIVEDKSVIVKGKKVGIPMYYKIKLGLLGPEFAKLAKEREQLMRNRYHPDMDDVEFHNLVKSDRMRREHESDWKERNKK